MYRKLGRDNKHRRSMLANLTKELIMHEEIITTETRAKEVRKFFDRMITHGKEGTVEARRRMLAFLQNDKEVVNKVMQELVPRFKDRKGGYSRIVKIAERRGDNALTVQLKLVKEKEKLSS